MNKEEVKGFIPAEKRVLLQLVDDETSSGLLTSTDKRTDRGVVVGRGVECKKKQSELGNEVLFNDLAVKKIVIDGRSVIMINEEQIHGTFKSK